MSKTHQLLSLLSAPLLDWLAPPRCAGCACLLASPEPFCPRCEVSVEPVGPSVCPRCGDPGHPGPGHLCSRCRRRPPPYGQARSACLFGGELARALKRYKYGGQLELATPLGRLWQPTLVAGAVQADALVAVPLTPQALRARGFHQVVELLRAARRGLTTPLPPLLHGALKRVGEGPAQASLSLAERRRLSARAFACPRPRLVAGCRLLLIDDVMTTGATAAACSRALLRAGATHVDVVTLARVP